MCGRGRIGSVRVEASERDGGPHLHTDQSLLVHREPPRRQRRCACAAGLSQRDSGREQQ
jgi:hypothetical protein